MASAFSSSRDMARHRCSILRAAPIAQAVDAVKAGSAWPIYAAAPVSPQNERARDWLDEQLNGTAGVGLPWHSLLAFLRVITNPRMTSRSITTEAAWRQVVEWIDNEPVWIPGPTEGHRDVLETPLVLPGVRGNLVPDAHLAALAIEHGLTLCSADGDFARFPSPRWQNPLSP